ncbi:hypothetical protein FVEN_g1988 [Fusarium venenatum]|nr:hypothetical protein FVEN_g1988 [Fusarium venenatum]
MDRSNDARGLDRRKACDFCSERKYKCDTKKPKCSNCVLHMVSCVWKSSTPSVRESSSDRVTGIERRLRSIEAQMRRINSAEPTIIDNYLCPEVAAELTEGRYDAKGTTDNTLKVESDAEALPFQQTDPFPLPPSREVKAYVENYFSIFNKGIPLFVPKVDFNSIVGEWYAVPEQRNHDNWARINVVIALAIRYTSDRIDDHRNETESLCIANVQSAVSKFASQQPSILTLQITLGLALVFVAGQDPRSASNLIAIAVKMIHRLKIHLPPTRNVPIIQHDDSERLFWIAYIIDRDLSLLTSEPYLLQDHEVGLDLKTMPCSLYAGNVFTDFRREKEILRPRAELARIQGKLYDLVHSVRASKFSYSQKQSAKERLYRMLEEWHKGLDEPDFDSISGKISISMEARSCLLHETLLHLAYYRCLYSVDNLSIRNTGWLRQLKDFSYMFNRGQDTRILTSALPLLPFNWRNLADAARCCNELVLGHITEKNPTLRWISAPVFEATATVLAAHLIALPERDLEETIPNRSDVEYDEIENDECVIRQVLRFYREALNGVEDYELSTDLRLCEEVAAEASRTVERFFKIAPAEFWDTRNGGFSEDVYEDVYLRL